MPNIDNTFINFINSQVIDFPNSLNDELTYKNKKFNSRQDLNEIKEFIDDFIKGDNVTRYLILPGLRGVGKTTMLYQIYEYLVNEKRVNPNNILYLATNRLISSFNYSIMDAVDTFLSLKHNSSLNTLNENVFLLIDEAHFDSNWSMTGNIIYDASKKIFMVFTGSSALNLEYNADSARRLYDIPINPLNYGEHLKLKYDFRLDNVSKVIKDLIFDFNVEKAIACEKKINTNLTNLKNYNTNDWINYLEYGGFPSNFFEKRNVAVKELNRIINCVISVDMESISDISFNTQLYASRLLSLFALQKPGDISQNKMANYLDCPVSTVKNILEILEKTHLIFHCEPYSSSAKRIKKSWKYYFATSSLRHSLALSMGNPTVDLNAYRGILLENLVASNLFNLVNKGDFLFNIYYDPNKGGVDFLIQRGFSKPIPIEVGFGKKSKKQILQAINNYDCDYGFIISNNYLKIEEEDNIIFLPAKIFSFL